METYCQQDTIDKMWVIALRGPKGHIIGFIFIFLYFFSDTSIGWYDPPKGGANMYCFFGPINGPLHIAFPPFQDGFPQRSNLSHKVHLHLQYKDRKFCTQRSIKSWFTDRHTIRGQGKKDKFTTSVYTALFKIIRYCSWLFMRGTDGCALLTLQTAWSTLQLLHHV